MEKYLLVTLIIIGILIVGLLLVLILRNKNNNNFEMSNLNQKIDKLEKDLPYDISNKFEDRLLLFDCMNSLMWLYKYPNHSIYKDVLFNKSKKLLK